jgi:hypothetical protein
MCFHVQWKFGLWLRRQGKIIRWTPRLTTRMFRVLIRASMDACLACSVHKKLLGFTPPRTLYPEGLCDWAANFQPYAQPYSNLRGKVLTCSSSPEYFVKLVNCLLFQRITPHNHEYHVHISSSCEYMSVDYPLLLSQVKSHCLPGTSSIHSICLTLNDRDRIRTD